MWERGKEPCGTKPYTPVPCIERVLALISGYSNLKFRVRLLFRPNCPMLHHAYSKERKAKRREKKKEGEKGEKFSRIIGTIECARARARGSTQIHTHPVARKYCQ